ncbi:MAG: type II toxin-antitoxin system HipA family toxin [Propionibacteriaceae bacterium]|jgi:serine/threonine-protein kinase HipA|nr:type II toxin-antitoxin system HipA family toxin [Propionibacteriaceae bacterium]
MLHVLVNGRRVGDLDGRGDRLRLRYDPDVLDDPAFTPLSTGLPPTRLRWRGRPIINWIAGLLPGRDGVVRRWRAAFGITDTHPESLLAHVGEDVAGAAQFVRPERLVAVEEGPGRLTPMSESDLAGLLRAALADSLPYGPDTHQGRFSLAGAQAKFALQQVEGGWALPEGAQPSTHIFKPAIPGLAGQQLSEWLSMRAAARLGLPTAHTFIVEFGGESVVAVERYDRVMVEGRWWRVHQESLCQAVGLHPLFKYESQGGPGTAAVAALIRERCGAADVEAFARAVCYNFLIRGSDAHADNYSILITPGNNRLAPLYDLNTTLTFGETWAKEMAMRVGGESRFDRIDHGSWDLFARDLGLDPAWVVAQLRDLAQRLPDAIADVRSTEKASDVGGVGTLFQDRAAQWARRAVRLANH